MISTKKLLAAASGIALSAIATMPAFAAGTTAGSTITNNVTINYSVGGVAQTQIDASNDFVVDRRITLTVAESDTATTSVGPGQTIAVTTFTVTNTSNAPLDLGLAVAQQTGGAGAHANTDTFDVTAPTLYVDTNTNGTYDDGTDLPASYLDEVAADGSRTVFVVAAVPITAVNGGVAAVTLTAQAFESGVGGTQGALVTETAGANTAGVDTVFADTAGATDANRDGQFSAKDDYTVAAPVLTVTKVSRVISDPFNGTTNPKMIPGATLEYCIVVANAAGGATASSVAISDVLPAQTAFVAGTIRINGTATGTAPNYGCNADGAAGGSEAAGTVSGTLASIPANTNQTLYFQVTIN